MLSPRNIRFVKLGIDAVYLGLAFIVAYLLRFDGEIPFQHFKQMTLALPYVLAVQIFFLVVFRSAKKRFGINLSKSLVQSVSMACLW